VTDPRNMGDVTPHSTTNRCFQKDKNENDKSKGHRIRSWDGLPSKYVTNAADSLFSR